MSQSEQRLRDYQHRRERVLQMGGAAAIEKRHKEGLLSARERIDYFFDPGTFTEIGTFVEHRTTAFGLGGKSIPAEGVVTGYGKVNGRLVMVASEDYTSMAGTFGEYHGRKFAQAIDLARDMGVPFVGMNDSAGARLQEGMDTLQAYAWLFRSQILASGIIPQVALVMGTCLGGQAYHPIMQDFVFQNRNTGFLGIAGPAFVKEQLGEDIDLRTLCGVEAHAVKSGQTHVVTEDDKDALDKARELLAFLPQNNREKPPMVEGKDDPERACPALLEIVPDEANVAFDMHKVIREVVDDGHFFELLRDYARCAIIGFARFNGRVAGVVASQPAHGAGAISCDAADKMARFVRFCDLFNIPVITLHDTPGYMIGSKEDWKGMLRHGAKTLYAYIDATVPKISVIVRKSFAGAYLGMSCKDTGADLVFAWPGARVTIVGAETAASVVFAREIREADNPAEVRAARVKEYRDMYENPYKGAERGYIDDVILPQDTRKYINRRLDLLANKQVARPWRKFSNINL
jgi:acetyl-CoA carboxylase carboxyltransferase component